MSDIYKFLKNCNNFEWDEHNSIKNWEKHQVTPSECEQFFFNHPLIIAEDIKHSLNEKRLYALGKTDLTKKLFIVFTIRNKSIRVISARQMSKKEKMRYEYYEK